MSDSISASRQRLDVFLQSVDRRAFKMASIATGHHEDALDIVQDAMLDLVKKYGNKADADLAPLFFRILQNKIRDWYRRQAVRRRWRVWFGGKHDGEGEFVDPVATMAAPAHEDPATMVMNGDAIVALENALRKLPLRQQQTFLLRAWQGLSVAETAHAMGCTEGSVKTHYSRARETLRGALEDHAP